MDEVKNDPESAIGLYKQADEIEQEVATRHTFHTVLSSSSYPLSLLTYYEQHSQPNLMAQAASEDEMDIAEAEGTKQRKNKQPEGSHAVELETISRAKKRKKRDRERLHSLKSYVASLSHLSTPFLISPPPLFNANCSDAEVHHLSPRKDDILSEGHNKHDIASSAAKEHQSAASGH